MKVPQKLPIMRMEDYHTHYLGQTKDGRLFWGYETFVFIKPQAEGHGEDSEQYRKEYALLHTFDKDGNYLRTSHTSIGAIGITGGEQLNNYLEKMVNALGGIEFQDIEVKLFETIIDDITFGLIVDQKSKMITLQPSSTISFQEPWDGEYYT